MVQAEPVGPGGVGFPLAVVGVASTIKESLANLVFSIPPLRGLPLAVVAVVVVVQAI